MTGQAWIAAMYEELAGAGEALKSEYPSLSRPSGIHVSRCFALLRGASGILAGIETKV
jgi:hypothetical protein